MKATTSIFACRCVVGMTGLMLWAGPSVAAEVQPVIKAQAQEFPLTAVKLLDSPFKSAMEVDKAYIMGLDPDRLLSGFREEAGLPKKADCYGGWERIDPGKRWTMAGHSLGHYLSALCTMYESTGDEACRQKAEYVVNELATCQAAGKDGMLAAFPQSRELFAEIAAGNIHPNNLNDLNGGYVPLYSIHKVMAGLRDAWLILGNQTARDVLIRQMDWLDSLVGHLSDAQVQLMLKTEQGGIVESATDVYMITGDKKYLALARRLNDHRFFDPLVRGEDVLTGVHGNASIPKAYGAERIYELTGDKDFGNAARFFWSTVVYNRSFVIGGHGCEEYFFGTNEFETVGIVTTGPETCNSYNMLKLSRALWMVDPSAKTSDFVERTLYNHILSSEDPDGGGFVYFTPMRPGGARTYDHTGFTCCDGTGMENHAKYGSFIYAHENDKLWVDLMIPSELNWAEQGAKVKLETDFPNSGRATLTFTMNEPRKLAVNLRNPGWLKTGDMKLAVNGESRAVTGGPDSYETVERTWKTGDKLEVTWPMALRTEWLPRSTNYIAVLWGPVVLAGELGDLQDPNASAAVRRRVARNGIPTDQVPVFVGTPDDVLREIKSTDDSHGTFHTAGLAKPSEVTLAPFYTVHHQPYAVYWHLVAHAANDVPGGG